MPSPTTETPWGLTGPQFLSLFFLGYVVSLLAMAGIRAVLLRTGARGVNPETRLDLYQTAYLAGGPARVVNTAIAQLALSGRILASRGGSLTVASGTTPLSDVEAAVVEAVDLSGKRKAPRRLRKDPRILAVGDQLRAQGLLLDGARLAVFRAAALLPVAVWCIGLARVVNGAVLHRPVGALVAWLIVTAFVTVFIGGTFATNAAHRPSADGRRLLMSMRDQYDAGAGRSLGVSRAPGIPHSAQLAGVALLGFTALSDVELRHSLISYAGGSVGSGSDGSGSDGSSSGCGGGGCGGGGCGG
ncbi:TIGR04222 domain-containing membrane protein [Mycobacterium sp. OTB74]|uniref:TIGR04222 domain-containing membrane protein n=1 Tax=Mycobacterium sp. OTB74 TaxID=1853452 RepID=UPI0024766564|nr:TIGR04222 domain-containing membrane protein [Mycobacterium sp. OTB74]MDH6244547.1 uncharacterized protein (TIGR04222 family) [Mycobacterium sp. OTB74]